MNWFPRRPRQSKTFYTALSAAAPRRRPFLSALRDFFAAIFAPREASSIAAFAQLTPREREIVVLIAQGYTNKEIADALVIAPDTVKSHVRNILLKLGLHSKAELRLFWANREWEREA